MKKLFTSADKAAVSTLFAALNGIDWGEQLNGLNVSSTLDLWVDQVNGSDSNDGSQSTPFQTIRKATDQLLTATILANVTVHVKKGTYIETVLMGGSVPDQQFSYTIQGEDTETPVGLAGAMSGTFTSTVNAGTVQSSTASLSGANWTVNQLKGYFVKIITGSLAGQIYPISSNTATALELPIATSVNLNGSQFAIVQMSAVIKSPSTTPAIQILGTGHRQLQSHFLKNLWVDHSATNATCMYVGGNQCFKTISCKFVSSGGNVAIQITSAAASYFPTNCWLEGVNGESLYMFAAQSVTATSCHFQTTSGTGSNTRFYRCDQFRIVAGVVDGGQIGCLTGSSNQEAGRYAVFDDTYFRNQVQQGIYTRGAVIHVNRGRITGPTDGIVDICASINGMGPSGGRVHLNSATIDNCAIGVNIQEPYGYCSVEGTTAIQNCTTGVVLGNGVPYNFNAYMSFAYVDIITAGNPGLVMTGNGNDFQISPNNNVSLAQVLAAPNQIISDSNYFNRISVALVAGANPTRQPYSIARTTAVTDIWVDAVNGSDQNTGADVSHALQTLSAAISPYLNTTVLHNVTIHVKAGTYVGNFISVLTMAAHTSAIFTIQGEDWTVQSLGGTMTGTFNGFTAAGSVKNTVATLSTAAWTTNALKGFFVHVTSGGLSGSYLPIASNTATDIELCCSGIASLNGITFEIVAPAFVLKSASANVPALQATVNGMRYGAATQGFVQFKNVFFDHSAVSATCVTLGGSGKATFVSCKFLASAGFDCIDVGGPLVLFQQHCYGSAVGAGQAVRAQNFGYYQSTPSAGCYYQSTTSHAFRFDEGGAVTIAGVVEAGTGGTGITNGASGVGTQPCSLYASGIYIRPGGVSATNGIVIKGGSAVMVDAPGRISGFTTGEAIGMQANSGTTGGGSPGSITLGGITIDTCLVGIEVDQDHVGIQCTGTNAITGCTTGVVLASGKFSSHNSFANRGTMTMSGNGVDFQISATPLVTNSWANLQAATNKIITDLNTFNRLSDG